MKEILKLSPKKKEKKKDRPPPSLIVPDQMLTVFSEASWHASNETSGNRTIQGEIDS